MRAVTINKRMSENITMDDRSPPMMSISPTTTDSSDHYICDSIVIIIIREIHME
jgi:hypothetical protein